MASGPRRMATGSISGKWRAMGWSRSRVQGWGSEIGIGGRQMVAQIARDTVLESGERPVIASGAQPRHARLGEILVALADRLRRVDVADRRRLAEAAEDGGGEIGE